MKQNDYKVLQKNKNKKYMNVILAAARNKIKPFYYKGMIPLNSKYNGTPAHTDKQTHLQMSMCVLELIESLTITHYNLLRRMCSTDRVDGGVDSVYKMSSCTE